MNAKALLLVSLLLVPVCAHAQYFGCGQINYFGDGCAGQAAQAEATLAEKPLPPMWEPHTIEPTTPTVAVDLLTHPTRETALRFAQWHLMRQIAIHRAQEVLEHTMATDDGIKALQSYFRVGPEQVEAQPLP